MEIKTPPGTVPPTAFWQNLADVAKHTENWPEWRKKMLGTVVEREAKYEGEESEI